MDVLQGAGVAAGAMTHIADLLGDPQLVARGWDPVQTLDEVVADPVVHASGAIVATAAGRQTVASPVSFDGFDPGPIARAPEAGEHTEQILLELGLDWPDIAALHDAGVIP